MTDLERRSRHSTAWSGRRLRLLLRGCIPALVVAAAPLSLVLSTSGPAGATALSDAQAKASQLQAEITATGSQIDALSQQYDQAEAQKGAIDQRIATTRAQIVQSRSRVAKDRSDLRAAAVNAYVTGGTSAAGGTLFSAHKTATADAAVFDQVLTGNLSGAMDQLDTAIAQLASQHKALKSERAQVAQAIATAANAQQQAQVLQAQEETALNQVNGQIAVLVAQQKAAQAAAQQAAAHAALAAAAVRARTAFAPPPPAAGGAGTRAVAAAESQLGVPYEWGGEDPGVGFDCSGLTAWAWGQAGVSLPHFSGGQMADSTPVPVSDLQPGDLLFYGPGGDTHVAMYVGSGEMIEAPHTGTVVRIDPIRLGGGFAGAGRP